MKRCILLCVLCLLSLATSLARAQSCSGTMANIVFGNVSTIQSAAVVVNGNLNISCSGFSTPYAQVCVSIGSPNTFFPRSLNGPTSTKLTFDIYKDSTLTNVFSTVNKSPTDPLAVSVPLSAGAGAITVTYYAQVFGSQTSVPSGSYSVSYTANDTRVQAVGYTTNPPACSTGMSSWTNFGFNVTASVTTDCNVTASSIDFGQRGLANTSLDATGTISSTCTFNAPYKLTIDAGQGAGASLSNRKLTRAGGSETLPYALYTDAARTQIWGDGSGGSSTVSGTGNGNLQTSTIYARLPAGSPVTPGSYVDTLVLTITY